MPLNLKQPSMSAGELSPSLYARTDLEVYRTGLSRCENFFVGYQGGVKRRSGFRFIGQCKTNQETILIPFQFSTQQTYVLEVGPQYIRFIANGAYVEDGGVPVEVATPYLNGDLSRLTYTQSADVLTLFHKSYPVAELRRTSAIDFEYTVFSNQLGPFETINSNEANTIYASAQSGTVTLTANFSAFNDNVVGKLLYLEQQTSGEVRTWVQRMSVSPGDKIYYAGNYYECTEAPVSEGNAAQTGDTPPTHLEGEIWDGPGELLPDDNRDSVIGVKWRYLHSGFGIVRIDSYSSATVATGTVITTIPESAVGGTIPAEEWEFLDQSTQKTFTLSTPDPTSSLATDFSVTLNEVGGSRTASLSYISEWTINFDTNQVTLVNEPNTYFVNDPPPNSNADVVINQKSVVRETYKWAFEPWREDTGYPQCGTYYQQRLTFASTLNLPQTIWLSVTDSFNSFRTSRPLLADDTMRFDVNSLQVNEIYNLAPLNALLAFTAGGVWSLNQGSNDVITPENPPSVRIQSYDGAAPIRPIITGSTGLYVQDGGQIVRDIGFDFSNDAFVGNDLTVRSAHLFEGREIVSWAYAKNPDKIIWVVFSDGEMAAFTYLREQSVWGWAPCSTDGDVKSLTVIREGSYDIVYAVINRGGVNYVERLEEWMKTDRRDNFFVDSGLTYDGRETTGITLTISATNYTYPNTCTVTASSNYFDVGMEGRDLIFDDGENKTIITIDRYSSATSVTGVIQKVVPDLFQNTPTTEWGLGATVFSGLDHLEGKIVSAFSDGADVGDYVVTGGSITLPSSGVVVSVGLKYEATIQTLDLELEQYPATTRTKRNIINKVYAYVRNTMALKGGTQIDSLYDLESREDEDYNTPPNLKTDVIEINCDSKWNRGGRVILFQDRPVSAEVLAIMPEITQSEM